MFKEKHLKSNTIRIAIGILIFVAFIFSAALPVNASSNAFSNGFNLSQLPITWDTQTFAGFLYDVDNNTGAESLIMLEKNGRIIPGDRLQYITSGQPKTLDVVKYAFNNNYTAAMANGLEQFDNGSMAGVTGVSGAGQYTIVGWQTEKFVSIKNKPNKLSRLIINQVADKKTLAVGQSWDIGNGMTLTAAAIDARSLPRTVWLVLSKDGVKLDDKNVSTGTTAAKPIYTYVGSSLSGEINVPLLVTFVDSIFSGATSDMVQLRYTWAIDTTAIEVKGGDKFGVFTVQSTDPLVLNNTGNPISLIRDSTVTLMGNMKFKVANNDSLRFYPYVEYITPGTYEKRGTVASNIPEYENNSVSWNAQSFAGFFYDLNYDRSTESLNLVPTLGNVTRTIAIDNLWYNTTIARVDFKAYEKENVTVNSKSDYSLVGWQAQNWIGINDKANKIAKLAFEMGKEDKKTLTKGETWSLGAGYELTINAIDARTSPRLVWFTLKKDGAIIDESIVPAPVDFTVAEKQKAIYFKTKPILGEPDSLLFTVYVDSIFSGATTDMVQFKYAWLIDESTATEIKVADIFGVFAVRIADSASINLSNQNNVSLSKNTETTIIGNIKFKVADNDTLRFYPMIAESVPPFVAIRGTVANGTGGITSPPPPQDLMANVVDGFVSLNWNPPSNNGGSDITGYKIYRSITPGGETLLATVDNILSYNDSSVVGGQTYYYRLSTVNSIGEGPLSNEINAAPRFISTCTVISSPGEYLLTADIMNSNNDACINITSSDVIFDGNTHTIDGVDKTNSTGVNVYNLNISLTNVTVKNLKVTDWNFYGIHYLYVSSGNIVNNIASSNGEGIRLSGSNNNTLTGNTATLSKYHGIVLDVSDNNNLINNTASLNPNGIVLGTSDNNTFMNNIIISNTAGLQFAFSSYNKFFNNYLNNSISNPIFIGTNSNNLWNTTKISGINIIGGPYIGGNFWAYQNDTGFSQTCTDADGDRICDSPFVLDANNTDYLPLSDGGPPVLTSIVVSPSIATLGVAGTQVFNAIALNGSTPMSGVNVSWTVSNGTVGSVSSSSGITDVNGNARITLTASVAGTTFVTAANGSIIGSASVTVSPLSPVLTSIVVSPSIATLGVAGTQVFNAIALNGSTPMSGVNVSWTVSNGTVGSVSSSSGITDVNGNARITLTASVAGTTFVNATNGSIIGSAKADVRPQEELPLIVNISPENGSTNDTGYVNVTVTLDRVGKAFLIWEEGVMESMAGAGTNFYMNKTGLLSGNFSFRVYASVSSSSLFNQSDTRIVRVNVEKTKELPIDNTTGNTSQEVNITSPSKNVTLNLDNGTNITFYDNNGNLADCGASKNITVNSWDTLPIDANLGNYNFAGENFSVDITCTNSSSILHNRIIPDAQLRFNYSGSIDITKLTIKYYNIFTLRWEDVEEKNIIRNVSGKYILLNTSHFSFFVLAIPAAAYISNNGGSGNTGNLGITSKEPADNIEKIETKSFYVAKDVPTTYKFNSQKGIYEIVITSNIVMGDMPIRLEQLKNVSKKVTESASDTVYYYTNIWVGSESGITESLFRFKVENSWITSGNIANVKMLKWVGGKWTGLETRQINKDDVYTYFEAKSNGLSQLAVVGVKSEVPVTQVTTVTREEANVSPTITPTVAPTTGQGGTNFNYILVLFAMVLVAAVIFIIAARTVKTPLSQQFIAKTREEYGEKYQEHLLEQYKLYVKIADKISERRQSANNSFLIFDSILICVFGILSGIESMARHHMWQYLIPLAGLLVSITWAALIGSSRYLQSIKLASIEKIESELPVALSDSEWKNSGEGKAGQYVFFNYIEQFVPWIFTGIYIILICITLLNL